VLKVSLAGEIEGGSTPTVAAKRRFGGGGVGGEGRRSYSGRGRECEGKWISPLDIKGEKC